MLVLLSGMCFFVSSLAAIAARTLPLDSKTAAAAINAEFLGTPIEQSGIVIRQMPEWSLYCGDGCYKGRPDCILSCSFYNSVVGVNGTDSTYYGNFPYLYGAGVVFNGTLARKIARCFYMYDGYSFYRYNGGCGCKAAKEDQGDCSNPHSPYANVAPDGTFVDGDNKYATQCLCTDDTVGKDDGNNCYWRGPMFNTSHGPYGSSEYDKVIKQRVNVVAPSDQWRWDELVMDAGLLKNILYTDPASAIVAVFYYNNPQIPDQNDKNMQIAQTIRQNLLDQYRVQFPIVECGLHAPVSSTMGPFHASSL